MDSFQVVDIRGIPIDVKVGTSVAVSFKVKDVLFLGTFSADDVKRGSHVYKSSEDYGIGARSIIELFQSYFRYNVFKVLRCYKDVALYCRDEIGHTMMRFPYLCNPDDRPRKCKL